jgi:hypothetical protein
MSHVNILELDLSKLQVGKAGRTIKLFYDKAPLQLLTPKMYSPFGVKVNNSDYSSFTNCHLDCSLHNSNSKEALEVDEALAKFDTRVAELLEVFDSNLGTLASTLKPNKDYPKLMKFSLPRDRNGNFTCVVFDENKEKVKLDDNSLESTLTKGLVFKGIIECGKVWNFNGRTGITWNVIQLRFAPKRTEQTGSSSAPVATGAYMMLE